MNKRYVNYLINLIFPVFIFGGLTGILTALTVTVYKFCAKHVIAFSALGYSYIRNNPVTLAIAVPALLVLAFLLAFIHKKVKGLKGGGIPDSVGILRGIITFKWLRTLVGTFSLSLVSFLVGVPLGNEGPSVLMGTAVGRASLGVAGKKHRAWDRYIRQQRAHPYREFSLQSRRLISESPL